MGWTWTWAFLILSYGPIGCDKCEQMGSIIRGHTSTNLEPLLSNSMYPEYMALPLSSPSASFLKASTPSAMQSNCLKPRIRYTGFVTNCESSSRSREDPPAGSSSLRIGSPVIVVEAPATLKTADSMPTLKVNMGQVKQGDVGR